MKKLFLIGFLIFTLFFFLCLFLSPKSILASQTTFYVSPQGNDSNPGTEAQPFKTIEKAKQVVRADIAGGMNSDVTVFIRGGKYFLSDTLSFNEGDSGRNGYEVIYKNYPGEEPIIIGGQRITNWELYSGSIYRAYVGNWKFYTLMENGVFSTMARTPNSGFLDVETQVTEPCKQCGGVFTFTYKPGDLSEFDYSDAQVYVKLGPSASYEYWVETLPITNINFGNRQITVNKVDTWWPIMANARYRVRGSLDFLDEAGEYYLDESSSYLYYWPRSTPIASQEIVAPKMKRIIEVKGSSLTSHAKNIRFEGLTLMLGDFVKAYWMHEDTDNKHGLIYLENVENITVQNNTIQNAGLDGITLYGHAQYNTISGNTVENIGQHGIRLQAGLPEGDIRYVNKNNTVSNNYLYNGYSDGGSLWASSGPPHKAAIALDHSGDNTIIHNEIAQWPYAGIFLSNLKFSILNEEHGISWEDHWDYMHNKNNTIAFNDVSHVMEDSNDGGGIYVNGSGAGNVINNNLIHDIASGVSRLPQVHGIYLDEEAYDWTVTNNIVYGVSAPFHASPLFIHRSGHFTFTNNIFADNPTKWAGARAMVWIHPEVRGAPVDGQYTFERNIVYQEDGYYIYNFAIWDTGYVVSIDNNLYYHPGGSYHVQASGDRTFSTWQSWGYDTHSITADPLFDISEAGGKRIYNLKHNSPALALGFEPIDQSQIGPGDAQSTPTPTPPPSLKEIIQAYGGSSPDLNNDGVVNGLDFGKLLLLDI